ncbi:MAG TPA: protein jag [Firmicutes bacterium]|nr:protein jag [Bacillota bacterium]
MRAVEKRGRSVEEAVSAALAELGLTRDEVDIEVVEEPSKGLFGFLGGREAVVRVRERESRISRCKRFVEDIFRAIGVDADVQVRESEEYLYIEVKGESAGALIGHRGRALDALQYLINLSVGRDDQDKRKVVLDIEEYRKRREETLRRVASRAGERVKRTRRPVALEPMSAAERRVVHMALQGDPEVSTHSEGDEPYRHVVISLKRG